MNLTVPSLPWLGTLEDLKEVVLRHRVDRIYVALPLTCFDRLGSLFAIGRELGVRLSFHVSLSDRPSEVGSSNESPMVVEFFRHASMRLPGRLLKRTEDVCC